MKKVRSKLGVSLGALAASVVLVSAAHAQVATSGIEGDAEPNATVSARNVSSGFTSSDVANADGQYEITGLQPGTYEISTTVNGQPVTRTVRVLLGQTPYVNLGPADDGEIVVTGVRRLDDPTTSEVGTNVTTEQIEGLPQFTRNFINFAALAPGVRTTQESTGEVSFSSGGQYSQSVNVFIDGQSQKSQIIDGGIAGQDDSRGNPFPQLAIQEFRVLTQNFSAEYDTAAAAIITSVTRSGGNEFEGEIFGTYQPSDWVDYHHLGGNTDPDPEQERRQYGFAIGGPIVQDQMHFFLTYERREDDKFSSVSLGRTGYEAEYGQYQGTVEIPFEQDILFGKLSLQPAPNHRFDLSATYRAERDLRDVGGQNAAERANTLDIDELKFNLRHDWQGDGWSNLLQLDFLESTYNPTAINFVDPGRNYLFFRDDNPGTVAFDYNFFAQDGTLIRLGGNTNNQNIRQQSFTVRDDFTFPEFSFLGEHVLQIGGRMQFNNYNVVKAFNENPQYFYDVEARPEITGSDEIPVRVEVAYPGPDADVNNTVTGFYLQDTWQVTERLELNLGLRWDYEDNAFNNDYVTPDRIVDLLAAYEASAFDLPFDPANYISNGDRSAFTEAWQPRIGFSYDLFGDESTVIFGGAGRYYDRVPYNFAFDERYKPTQTVYSFNFAGPGAIAWDPSYATPGGLQALIDSSQPSGEIFLIQNGAEPPVTDQFNIGIRQAWNDWRFAATLAYSETQNGYAWYRGNIGGPTPASLGFPEYRGTIFYSTHDQEREYEALYLTADKPYDEESGWGFSIAYTLSEARQNGSRDSNTAPFDFDYATVADSPWYYSNNDERHRVVATGMLDLPWDTRVSGIYTYGSGTPFHTWGVPDPWNLGRREETHVLDMRLSKFIDFEGGHRFEVFIDGLNLTNEILNPNIEQCVCGGPNFGLPFNQVIQGRSFQVGARARW